MPKKNNESGVPEVRPEELLQQLIIGAVEQYALGVTECIYQPDAFRTAIPPLAKAWDLSAEVVDAALEVFTERCRVIDELDTSGIAGGTITVYNVPLLHDPTGEEMLGIFTALGETLVRLTEAGDKAELEALLSFLRDYWDIDGTTA